MVRAPREPEEPRGVALSIPAGLGGPLAQAFGWFMLGALLVILVLALGDAWRRRQRGFELDGKTAAADAPAPDIDVTMDPDLESLVRAGRWAEAVHLLLQLAVRRLEHRLRRTVPPNLTSREMLRLRDLEAPARTPLSTLVEAVELSHFGGLPATREDFQRCAEAYQRMGTGR